MATPQPFKEFIVRYRKGDRIYSKGDPGHEMYIVQSGTVEIFRESGSRRVSLAVMEKGDFFGEMALIESAPHSACAEALEECELIEINSTLFDKMIKGNIEIAVRMLRKLSIRLRDATRRIEELAGPAAASASSPRIEAAAVGVAVAAAPQRGATIPVSGSSPTASGGPATSAATAVTAAPGRREPEARPPVAPVGAFPTGCHAAFISEDGSVIFPMVLSRAAIGRFDPVTGLKPEVDLTTLDLNRSVSRHHARVLFEGGAYTVTEEVGALNGTFINGRRLVSGKPSRIQDGDVVNLGMVKLFFKETSSHRSPGSDIGLIRLDLGDTLAVDSRLKTAPFRGPTTDNKTRRPDDHNPTA